MRFGVACSHQSTEHDNDDMGASNQLVNISGIPHDVRYGRGSLILQRSGKYFVEVDFKWNVRKQDARHEFALTNAKTLRGIVTRHSWMSTRAGKRACRAVNL